MNQAYEIVVVGGGIVGLSAALSMAQRGCTVAVIDSGPLTIESVRKDIRVYAINQASQQLFQQLGVWQNIEDAKLSPYRHMHVWDSLGGASIEFDSRAIASPYLGVIVEESVLKQALIKTIEHYPTIHLYPNHNVDHIVNQPHCISVSSDALGWDGQLLMIADGANSPARDKLQVGLTTWSYNQNALVATVRTELSHNCTAYQVFHPEGPLAFLPLKDPHHCSIVWSNSPAQTQRLMNLQENEFNQQVTEAFASKLGDIHLVSSRFQFPLRMRHVKQYVGERWMVLGDAAHTIHPLAGLGLNLGLADVRSWLNCIDSSERSFDSKRLLGAYQRDRKNSVWQMILLMDGFKRLFGTSSMPLIQVRSFGLNLCNNLASVKRFLIQQAAGS